jgi:copper homeostasis protein
MLEDIQAIRELGFPGMVTGVLDEDGNVDMPRMQQIIEAAGGWRSLFIALLICVQNRVKPLKKLRDLGLPAS